MTPIRNLIPCCFEAVAIWSFLVCLALPALAQVAIINPEAVGNTVGASSDQWSGWAFATW